MFENIVQADKDITVFFNSLNNVWADSIFYFISNKYTWIPIYIGLLFFVIKKGGKSAIPFILYLALMILAADQTCNFVKHLVERLRPCHDGTINGMIHIVKNHCGGKYGFFSSHAANFFALATFTSIYFRNKTYFIVAFILAIITSYSRIYLGVHFLGDVVCGAYNGILWGIIASICYSKFGHKLIKGHQLYGRL
ncbi:MAG: phosphatase PAP2 family protein [Bacteroidales bacterium]|nr:phosphatase PAP2 family protein [Bacteroidales bacterium]